MTLNPYHDELICHGELVEPKNLNALIVRVWEQESNNCWLVNFNREKLTNVAHSSYFCYKITKTAPNVIYLVQLLCGWTDA
jgi:hypothetical protein